MICLLCLGACDVPAQNMLGAQKREISVGGSQFSVYIRNDRAEAIRTNVERRKGIMQRGYAAIEQASGCQIVPGSYEGDPSRMTAKLACSSS